MKRALERKFLRDEFFFQGSSCNGCKASWKNNNVKTPGGRAKPYLRLHGQHNGAALVNLIWYCFSRPINHRLLLTKYKKRRNCSNKSKSYVMKVKNGNVLADRIAAIQNDEKYPRNAGRQNRHSGTLQLVKKRN